MEGDPRWIAMVEALGQKVEWDWLHDVEAFQL